MIEINIDEYQGPLDLLLELIRKNKVDIYDIPINEITAEYLDILKNLAGNQIEIKVEFLYLAATLLRIKTKMLLPKDSDEDEDPRDNLVEQLIIYSKFKFQSQLLRDRLNKNLKSFNRLPDRERFDIGVSYEITGNPLSLRNHITKLVGKLFEVDEDFQPEIIKKDKYEINELTIQLLDVLKDFKKSSLQNFTNKKDKEFIITAFLAVLELLNSGTISFRQENNFDDIILEIK